MPIVHDEQASTRSHSNSVLDRSIVSILPHPDDTPSRRRRRRPYEEEVVENNTTVDRVTKIHKNNNNNNNDEHNDTADDDDVTVEEERLHRLHGTSLIRSSCQLLRLSTCCFGTACTLFHRYFHAISLREMDVWSVAMASIVIASKITPLPFHQTTTTTTTQIEENDDDNDKGGGGNKNYSSSSSGEGVLTLHQVILVFAHLYRKRRMIYIAPPNKNDDGDDQQVVSDNQQDKNNKKSTTVVVVDAGILPIISEIVQHPSLRNAVAPEAYWSWKKKQQYLKDGIPPMSTLGPVWKEWYNAVTNTEHKILRQLGFTLYWIPTHLPHYYLASFCSTILQQQHQQHNSLSLSSSSSKQHNIQTRAWNYCNDSFLLDFCVRYPPNQVACAALYLACLEVWLNNDDHDNDDKNNNKNNNDSKDAHYIIEWLEFWSDWPERLCGANANEIATLSNALLGLTTTTTTHCSSTNNHNHNDHNNNNNKADLDRQVAFYAFVPPLFRDSFNGPYSFLWDMANDSAHNENQSSKSKNMNNNNNNT